MAKKCKLCDAGEMSNKWIKDMLVGKKSPQTVANQFGVTVEEVMDHAYNHEQCEVGNEMDALTFEQFLDTMKMQLNKINNWFKIVIDTDEPTTENVAMAVKLIKEIRDTLRVIAEIEGKLAAKGDTTQITVQIAAVQKNYKQLTNLILKEVCPACQEKLILKMEAENLLELPNKT